MLKDIYEKTGLAEEALSQQREIEDLLPGA
jgi:hypothetical protein